MKLSITKDFSPPPLITNLSLQQQDAVNFVTSTTSNLILQAYAGSGKTYTLEAILCAINNHFPSATVATLSFNNKIETELQARFSRRGILKTAVKTAHKFGKQACEAFRGPFRINEYKVPDILKAYPGNIPWPIQKTLARFISLGKDAGIGFLLPNSPDTWRQLYDHHDLDCEKFPLSRFLTIAENVLNLSNQSDKIDIADLIYLPLLHNWPIQQYDFVLVDEAQDINSVRRELIKRMIKGYQPNRHKEMIKGFEDLYDDKTIEALIASSNKEVDRFSLGRLIAVGDPHQAIYGFTGADHNALENLRTTFNATVLPLSTSYRCSTSVISHAQKLVPGITALPDAPTGSVTKITEADFLSTFKQNSPSLQTSAVLCRNNAPLIKQALSCLRASIPCRIEGKDVGKQLTSLIKKLS